MRNRRGEVGLGSLMAIIGVAVFLLLIPTAFTILNNTQQTLPGTMNTNEMGASYVIFQTNLNMTCVKNGSTSRIDYLASNAYTVIQYAINNTPSGGEIYIKTDSYETDRPLTLLRPVTITGQGYGTELRLADGSDCQMIDIRANYTNLENLHLNGNDVNQITPDYGVHDTITGIGSNSSIKHCWFSNFGRDAVYFSSKFVTISECLFTNMTHGPGGNACVLLSGGDSLVTNNRMIQHYRGFSDFFPVVLQDCYNVSVIGNEVYGGFDAIQCRYGGRHIISENRVMGMAGGGIAVVRSYGTIVSNNYVSDCREMGIGTYLYPGQSSNRTLITGNTVYNNGEAGIYVFGSWVVVSGNIVYNNCWLNALSPPTGIAIQIEGGNNSVVGNLVYDTNDTAYKTQAYGIAEIGYGSNETDYNVIVGNNVNGNYYSTIPRNYPFWPWAHESHSIIDHNAGVTVGNQEYDCGITQIGDTNTSVVVNHTLGTQPSSVIVTPLYSFLMGLYYVDGINSTSFTIYCENAATDPYGWHFFWVAMR